MPIKDAATLQPVDIPAGTQKQFWVTVNIPSDAVAGITQALSHYRPLLAALAACRFP